MCELPTTCSFHKGETKDHTVEIEYNSTGVKVSVNRCDPNESFSELFTDSEFEALKDHILNDE